MKQQDALGPMLGRAAQLTRACMDARLSRYGVTPAQTRVLMYLHRRGGQAPQRELTDYLEVRPSRPTGSWTGWRRRVWWSAASAGRTGGRSC